MNDYYITYEHSSGEVRSITIRSISPAHARAILKTSIVGVKKIISTVKNKK